MSIPADEIYGGIGYRFSDLVEDWETDREGKDG